MLLVTMLPSSSVRSRNAEPFIHSFVIVALLSCWTLSAATLPDSSLDLNLKAPIASWDEAIPLGNGLLGGLLWGEGSIIRFSLDRGDLWDERPSPRFVQVRDRFNWSYMQRLVAEDRMKEFNEI